MTSKVENTPPIKISSPHDAILSRMYGEHLVETEKSPRDLGVPRDTSQSIDRSSPAASHSTTNNVARSHREVLYDPFDGTALGLLVSPASQDQSPNQRPGPSKRGLGVENKEEQWVHLSRVLDLQNELAKMHLDMEGIGSSDGKGKGTGKSRRARTKGPGDGGRERRDWEEVKEGTEKGHAVGADVPHEDEEGVDTAGDEENEEKKAREAQFANLADHFAGRREAVNEIMDKLDDLSKALTEFHTLQAPQFEFSKTTSRQSSTTPDCTPPIPKHAESSPQRQRKETVSHGGTSMLDLVDIGRQTQWTDSPVSD